MKNTLKRNNETIAVSLAMCRKAYEETFETEMPDTMTYDLAARKVMAAVGGFDNFVHLVTILETENN